MAINITDTKHLEKFSVDATAEWQPVDVLPVGDPQAVAFSPPFVDLRPVLYIPVKRRGGVDTFPQIRLHVKLVEAELRRQNFDIPTLVGAEVKIDLANRFAPSSPFSFHTSLPSGRIDRDLKCDLTISADDVRRFLDPNGPMKARLNENLLQFLVEIPAITVDGLPLQGVSQNRVYFYRKKSIAFLPGVFGSQFEVNQGKGKKDAFPNFLDDDALSLYIGGVVSVVLSAANQRIGVLECDVKGQPILPAFKPRLLRFGGFVYDTFTKLREARHRKLTPVPDDFLVYDLRLFAYDWRGDLSECARDMMDRLRLLQEDLRSRPDTDDQIVIAGHSTGGVIIRKMLGEPGADGLISHAFFLNVPFRGAPKALSVFLTGCDPPGGSRMIPFIEAPSLRNIAACAPIVYHLAPSFAFRTQVADVPGGIPPGVGEVREREKSGLINAALESGIYFLRYAVATVPSSMDERAKLAAGADDWGQFIDDASVHKSGEAAYSLKGIQGSDATAKYVAFFRDEPARRNLEFQLDRRTPIGWNDFLAGRALEFHKASEQVAASGSWASKAFIFYSKGLPTTGRVVISSSGTTECAQSIPALITPQSIIGDWADGNAHPPEPSERVDQSLFVEQWVNDNEDLQKRFWTVSATPENGDGTVPLSSLLGFGGAAKVFQALPGNPKHTDAPNSDFLWDRVMELLEGFDVSPFFQSADTKEGRET